jgi:hypothetical protein
MEAMAHRNRWFTWVYLLKMGGSFHGYVKSPDGTGIPWLMGSPCEENPLKPYGIGGLIGVP